MTKDASRSQPGAVHRATAARWIGAAKQTVLERTQKKLMADLRLARDEVESLIRMVQSRIELGDDVLASG